MEMAFIYAVLALAFLGALVLVLFVLLALGVVNTAANSFIISTLFLLWCMAIVGLEHAFSTRPMPPWTPTDWLLTITVPPAALLISWIVAWVRPGTFLLNGFGTKFYGREVNDHGWITTKWLCIWVIPVLPVRSYQALADGAVSADCEGAVRQRAVSLWFGPGFIYQDYYLLTRPLPAKALRLRQVARTFAIAWVLVVSLGAACWAGLRWLSNDVSSEDIAVKIAKPDLLDKN